MPRQLISAFGLVALALALGVPARPAFAAEPSPAHAESGEGHATTGPDAAGGQPPIMDPQPPLAIWTVIVFVGLLLVLRRFAWRPLLDAMHQREEHMEHILLDAERARNESEALLAEHRKQLAAAAAQVHAMIEEARRDAQATSDEIIRKAQAEAEASQHRAEREIGIARDQALSEIWTKTADLAVQVAGRVLTRELNDGDHRRLVELAINELPASPTDVNGHGGRPS